MSTTNPVKQVLVTSGNQAVLAAGSRVTSLNNGQIGVFNAHTGLSVDGSVAGDCKDVFIAVGINRTLGGTNPAEDIGQSAGQVIQARNMRAYTFKGRVPEIQKVVEVTGFKALSNTPYGVKIEFRNQKLYQLNGFNFNGKTYNAQTSVDASGAVVGNNGELADLMIKDINKDPDALVVASAFGYQISATVTAGVTTGGTLTVTVGTETFSVPVATSDSTTVTATKIAAAINAVAGSAYAASSAAAILYIFPKVSAATGSTTATFALSSAGGTGVTVGSITAANVNISNVTTFRAANPNAGIGIRITGVLQARPNFRNDININYYKNGTDFIVSLPYGFEGVGSVATITNLQYAEGSGLDVKYQEYEAGGFNGRPGPYRQSSVHGLPRGGFEYFASENTNYHQFILAYDQEAVGGWLEYKNNLETVIAVPEADNTTAAGIATVLDAIFTQFGAMANDVTANDLEEVATNTLLPATDGIESLS